MGAREALFKTGDGRDMVCPVGSVAYDLMSKDGSFTLVSIDGERQPVSAVEPDTTAEPKKLSKMKKAQLVAYAEEIGCTVVPDGMTNAQIIKAIEEHLDAADTE